MADFRRPQRPSASGIDVDKFVATGEAVPVSEQNASSDAGYLWDSASPKARQSVLFKLPESEYLMLKWLAGTTYGSSQNGIAIEALRKEIKLRMEERGISVEAGEEGVLRVVRPAASNSK